MKHPRRLTAAGLLRHDAPRAKLTRLQNFELRGGLRCSAYVRPPTRKSRAIAHDRTASPANHSPPSEPDQVPTHRVKQQGYQRKDSSN